MQLGDLEEVEGATSAGALLSLCAQQAELLPRAFLELAGLAGGAEMRNRKSTSATFTASASSDTLFETRDRETATLPASASVSASTPTAASASAGVAGEVDTAASLALSVERRLFAEWAGLGGLCVEEAELAFLELAQRRIDSFGVTFFLILVRPSTLNSYLRIQCL